MALEKQTGVTITIDEDGTIVVTEVTRIVEDGTVLAENPHRRPFNPGDDASQLPGPIADIAHLVWPPAVIKLHQDRIAARLAAQKGTAT
jgi:hypothetical protein